MAAKGYIERMLGDQEKILLVARQHWFVVLGAIFLEIFMIVIVLAGIALVTLLPIFAAFPLLPYIIVAIAILLLLFPLATLSYDVMVWYNRQYIVTSRRVVQISGIFNKNVTDSSLEKVNDVKLSQSVFGRMFGYGDVEILTASELGVNLFSRIEDPIRFKTTMLNAKEKLERGDEGGPGRAGDIPALIAQLDKLRQQGVLTPEEFEKKKAELLAKM